MDTSRVKLSLILSVFGTLIINVLCFLIDNTTIDIKLVLISFIILFIGYYLSVGETKNE